MSKIMRLMYAEARAAREAAANPSEHRMRDVQPPASSALEWWATRMVNTGECLGSKIQARRAAPRAWTGRGMNVIDPRFPLGTPLNRSRESSLRPIPGRANWFVDSRGIEHYVEPTRAAPG